MTVVFINKNLKQIDPQGCVCQSCQSGESLPMEQMGLSEAQALIEGTLVVDNTGDRFLITHVGNDFRISTWNSSLRWDIFAPEVGEIVLGGMDEFWYPENTTRN